MSNVDEKASPVKGEVARRDEGIVNDEKRTKYLEQCGIKVIRISNLDVLKNFEGVCQYIDNAVKQSLSQLR